MMSSLKNQCIAQLLPAFQSGGAERTALDVGKAIVREGGRAIIITSGGRLVAEAEKHGITHITMPLQSKNLFIMLKNYFHLKKIFKVEGVTLVHARSRAPAWSGYYAAKALQLPFITTFHGLYGSSNALKRFYNRIMVRGEKVIANSDFTAEFIKTHYGHSDKIVTINRGVDVLEFNPENVSDERVKALKTRLNLDNRPVLFLPARLSAIKGHSLVIEAMAHLSPKPLLLIAGDGTSGVNQLHSRIKALDLEENIIFAGHISDMPAAYALSTLVLVPSIKAEGFGRIAIEAGAMGVPCIVSALGAMKETVVHEKTGWHTEANNQENFTKTLQRALSLPSEILKTMGDKAKAHILANYTLDKMINATLNVYLEVLGKK